MTYRARSACILGATLAVLAGAFAWASPASAQSSTTNPYRATVGWEQLPEGRRLGVVSGVIPDPDGRHLWILDRCGGNQCAGTDLDPILRLDLDGNLVDSFGAGLFAFPHGFFLDGEGYLWVTEGGSHGPSGVAVSPNGDIWISDGHRGGNNRLVRYSGDGRFISAVGGVVGSESKEAARFSDPHDVKVDSRGRVYVADRGNSRIQVFDPNGNLVYLWTHYGKPSGLFIDRDDILYAGDGLSGMARTGAPDPWRSNFGWEKGIRIGDLKTEQAWVVHFIPIPQTDEDVGAGIEFLGVDFAGNIYAGEVARERLVRYVPFRPPSVGDGR